MTEEKDLTFDRYRAVLADFRAKLNTMRTELNVEMVEMQKAIVGQTKWLAGLVGPTELKLRYHLTRHISLLQRGLQAVSWLFSALPLISDFAWNRH